MNYFRVFTSVLLVSLGYVVYFDYKRRNDAEFRKSLKKKKREYEHKQLLKIQEKESKSNQLLVECVESVKNIQWPQEPNAMALFFNENLQIGDELMRKDPSNHAAIAVAFYKALKVYKEQAEILKLYQHQLPEDIFSLIVKILQSEAQKQQSEYFNGLVSNEKFSSICIRSVSNDSFGMFARKNIKAGQVIYIEDPCVSVLNPSVQAQANHCNYCLCEISLDNFESKDDFFKCDCGIVFCSDGCLSRAQNEFHRIICTKTSKAGMKLYKYCELKGISEPLLVFKVICKILFLQIAMEQSSDSTTESKPLADWEHLEKLSALLKVQPESIEPTKEMEYEANLVIECLKAASPGVDQFFNVQQYMFFKQVFSELSFRVQNGQCFALYFCSSYICEEDQSDNVEVSFKYPAMYHSKSNKLTIPSPKLVLKAKADIAEGEQIIMSVGLKGTGTHEEGGR